MGNYLLVKTKKNLRQITDSIEAFKTYKWRTPEVITFKAQDGTNVNRLYKPELANANKAAILFVHVVICKMPIIME
jgi:dipeptidyl aminopeptidase/acylaminoacyl peptidase